MFKVLIVGANFINKGAQSMLFITMDEIRKRIPTADIYFATFEEGIDNSLYRFKTVYYNPQAVHVTLYPNKKFMISVKTYLKNLAKWMAGKKYRKFLVPVRRFSELTTLIRDINLIVDISGFGLGSKWGVNGSEHYLDNIRLAQKYSIPMILMPQSFGPFDYEGGKAQELIKEIKDVLDYPIKIFTREEQGYLLLSNELGLKNLEKSYDLVLQNKGIDYKNIFTSCYQPMEYILSTRRNIAIVPNVQCFRHGNSDFNHKLYKAVIDELLRMEKNVYIVSHASEDKALCAQIKALFAENSNVFFFEKDLTCLEYDKFITQFEYIICSRFHGVVHAYRNMIPCIILGWAIKYKELSKAVGQEQYCFDLTNTDDTLVKDVIAGISRINERIDKEKEIINDHLKLIQRNNCFDVIDMFP